MNPRSIFASSAEERNSYNNNIMSQLTDFRKKFDNLEMQSEQLSLLFGNGGNSMASATIIRNQSEDDFGDEDEDQIQGVMQHQQKKAKLLTASCQRVDNILKRAQQDEQQSAQMFGLGKKFQKVGASDSGRSTILMSQISQPRNMKIVKVTQPVNGFWRLGDALLAQEDGALTEAVETLIFKGCYICQGVGHCKTKCLTWKKISGIKTQLAKLSVLRAVEWFDEYGSRLITPTRWVMYDLIMTTANSEGEIASKKFNSDSIDDVKKMIRVQQNVVALHKEIKELQRKRCYFCDGYGHMHTEKTYLKPKRKDMNVNNTFLSIEADCDTKIQLTRKIFTQPVANKLFAQVVKKHKEDVAIIYKTEYAHILSTKKRAIREITSAQDAIGFYNGTEFVNEKDDDDGDATENDSFGGYVQDDLLMGKQSIISIMASINEDRGNKQDVDLIQAELDAQEEIEVHRQVLKIDYKQQVTKLQQLIIELGNNTSYKFDNISEAAEFSVNNLPTIEVVDLKNASRNLHKAFKMMFTNFAGIAWQDFQDLKYLTGFLSFAKFARRRHTLAQSLFKDENSYRKFYILIHGYYQAMREAKMKEEDITVEWLLTFITDAEAAQQTQLSQISVIALFGQYYEADKFIIPSVIKGKIKAKAMKKRAKSKSIKELQDEQKLIEQDIANAQAEAKLKPIVKEGEDAEMGSDLEGAEK